MCSKTLIVGDLHIGKGISIGKPSNDGSLNSRISDQVRILNWIIGTSLHRGVDRIIITGDVFQELKPDNQLVVIFLDWLNSCVNNGIEVHIIAGNHDLKRIGNRYSSVLDIIDISDVHIYNKIYTLHTSGASFTLVPFRDRRSLNADSLSEAMETIERCLPYELGDIPSGNEKVLVGHLAMEKSMYTDEIDDVSNEIMVPLSLLTGYQYVWMGHVHKPQIMSKVPYVAHIGSMDTSDFGETDQQKIVVLFDPSSSSKFEEIIIPTRPLKRIRLEIPKDQDPTKYLINYINTMDFRNSLVKLEISILDPDAPELDRSQIQALLASLGAYHISGFSESRHIAVIPEEKRHIDNSAIEPKVAVKLWAGLQDIPDDEKEDVITVCNEIIEEIQLNKKN